jgi:hypothetical protein
MPILCESFDKRYAGSLLSSAKSLALGDSHGERGGYRTALAKLAWVDRLIASTRAIPRSLAPILAPKSKNAYLFGESRVSAASLKNLY